VQSGIAQSDQKRNLEIKHKTTFQWQKFFLPFFFSAKNLAKTLAKIQLYVEKCSHRVYNI
jgi:hypothetical protein